MLKKDKEREKAGDYIIEESKKLSNMFLRLSHACKPKVQDVGNLSSHRTCLLPFYLHWTITTIHVLFLLSNVQYAQVLEMMGEVIKSKQEFLPLEISVS